MFIGGLRMTFLGRSLSRRSFLAAGGSSALAVPQMARALSSRITLGATLARLAEPRHVAAEWAAGDPSLHDLAAIALDAARQAGATFAEARVRILDSERWELFLGTAYPAPSGACHVGCSVRALVDGYWGFAANAILATPDEMARLGREATAQARSVATGKPRAVHLAPTPVVTGTWTMPVRIDPFAVPWEEKVDCIDGMSAFIAAQPFGAGSTASMTFRRDRRTLATSEGTFTSQTVFTSGANLTIGVGADWQTELPGGVVVDFLTPAGAGWEYIHDAPVETRAREIIAQAERMRRPKSVDIGRYDVVFDAAAMANIIAPTLGVATGLEHAMGVDANDTGTSFLHDPLGMVGTFAVGTPLLTLSANRSMRGGAATVRWDDEGVEPDTAMLITNGVVTDFQTTRESASWLTPWYQKLGRPLRSHGNAASDTGITPPRADMPNLVLAPGTHAVDFEELVASTKHGYAVLGGWASADHQGLNWAFSSPLVCEIHDGVLGSVAANASIVSRTPEFWHHVETLGGPTSAKPIGIERWAPDTNIAYTVSAVPAKVSQVAVSDQMRRA